ncbi:uncharacterized protein BDZ83DRAFT_647502 [Colletotrichum acutatum]|uniref:Uncharacterized protein n=1 Tax=Glomerella acutata TaxID=27357 RepID=A0AAD8XM39_GLOAC|nr:uncharacterized protein BDZ83DRAFT_647502 [Colletotrichum acutatum]KAK1729947.1 hypothetical protein BDZ83DRAFT_647502 [Colletotrichum acutatum]
MSTWPQSRTLTVILSSFATQPAPPRSAARCHHYNHQAQAGVLWSMKLLETIMVGIRMSLAVYLVLPFCTAVNAVTGAFDCLAPSGSAGLFLKLQKPDYARTPVPAYSVWSRGLKVGKSPCYYWSVGGNRYIILDDPRFCHQAPPTARSTSSQSCQTNELPDKTASFRQGPLV